VYVPASLAEAGLPVRAPEGPFQEKVVPLVVEKPLNNALVSEQVMVSVDVEDVVFGKVVFADTLTDVVVTHPVEGSVTVTV
jgi:hypothetical protein